MRSAGLSVSVAGTALKQFFSELREPVIPQSLYDELRDAVSKLTACCCTSFAITKSPDQALGTGE